MTQEKKNKIITLVVVSILGIVIIGISFAYLPIIDAEDVDFRTSVSTNTTDSLVFRVSGDILLNVSPSNFNTGMGNHEGVVTASAILKANNKTNNVTEHYYLYLDIKENGLTYTRDDKTAELLLQVTGPDGLVTTIDGLNYVTVTDGKGESISGFDITEIKDLITIVSNKSITTTSEVTETFEIKVILVNLDSDQSSNGGKRFNAKLEIQKEGKTLGDICSGKNLSSCLKENYELDSNLLYHDASLENGANDNSYRYAGSYESVKNYVCFGSDEETCPWDNMYRIIGIFGDNVKLIKADYAKASELGTNYLYVQSYLSFETEGINKGKNSTDQIGTYIWNGNAENNWKTSDLNVGNLNNVFLNNFSDAWQSKIATTSWKVGGNTLLNIAATFPANAYQNEIVSSENKFTDELRKIGLIYVSDYYYGSTPENWTKHGYTQSGNPHSSGNIGPEYDYRSAIDSNWIYTGLWEWTITPSIGYADGVFYIGNDGKIWNNNCGPGYGGRAIRPVFYLESNVVKGAGSGTVSDPMRIKI